MRLLRVIVAASLAVGLLGMYAPSVAAACYSGSLNAWENPGYSSDAGDGGSTTIIGLKCSVPNLRTWSSGGRVCNRLFPPPGNTNMDDCLSSWKFTAPFGPGGCYHYGFQMWQGTNYTEALLWSSWGPSQYGGGYGGYEDNVTAIKFVYRPTCPVGPAE